MSGSKGARFGMTLNAIFGIYLALTSILFKIFSTSLIALGYINIYRYDEQKRDFEPSFGALPFLPSFFVITTMLTNNEPKIHNLFPKRKLF